MTQTQITAYMDEAGFTGRNLLDPQQPILVHASLCDLGTGSLKDVIDAVQLPRSGQLKYSGLKANNMQRIHSLIFNLINSAHFHLSYGVANKMFALAAVCVEFIVEEAIAKKNMFADRNKLNCFAHGLYFEFLVDQKRKKSSVVNMLNDFFRPDRNVKKKDLERVLSRCKRASFFFVLGRFLKDLDEGEINRDSSLFISVSLIHNNVFDICESFPGASIDVIHDRTKFDETSKANLKRTLTEKFAGDDAVTLREFKYAFGLNSFEFESASDHLGIQVADLISGYLRDVIEKKVSLSPTEIEKLPIPTSMMLPETNPADLPDLSSRNGDLDAFSFVLSKSRKKE